MARLGEHYQCCCYFQPELRSGSQGRCIGGNIFEDNRSEGSSFGGSGFEGSGFEGSGSEDSSFEAGSVAAARWEYTQTWEGCKCFQNPFRQDEALPSNVVLALFP